MAIVPFVSYPGQTVSGDPGYPLGRARNVSVSGDGTGTPWEAQLINDVWGFHQSLLSDAEISPTGVPEAVGASQYLDAMKRIVDTRLARMALSSRQRRATAGSFAGVFRGASYMPNVGFYVIVGDDGEIQTSPDGSVWTKRTPSGGGTALLRSVAYGYTVSGEGVVVSGDSGEILYSTNGTSFARYSPGSSYSGTLHSAAARAASTTWCVVGSSGEIQSASSLPPTTWTRRQGGTGYSGTYRDIEWCAFSGGAMFVAVGEDGRIVTSPDGLAWTARTAAESYSGHFYSVHYGQDTAVAIGVGGEVQASADGLTWHRRRAASGTDLPGKSCYDAATGMHVAPMFPASLFSGSVMVSRDAYAWSFLRDVSDNARSPVLAVTSGGAYDGAALFVGTSVAQSLVMP